MMMRTKVSVLSTTRAEERIRGAEPRFWQDMSKGEALPTMLKGPDDGDGLHRLRAGPAECKVEVDLRLVFSYSLFGGRRELLIFR